MENFSLNLFSDMLELGAVKFPKIKAPKLGKGGGKGLKKGGKGRGLKKGSRGRKGSRRGRKKGGSKGRKGRKRSSGGRKGRKGRKSSRKGKKSKKSKKGKKKKGKKDKKDDSGDSGSSGDDSGDSQSDATSDIDEEEEEERKRGPRGGQTITITTNSRALGDTDSSSYSAYDGGRGHLPSENDSSSRDSVSFADSGASLSSTSDLSSSSWTRHYHQHIRDIAGYESDSSGE